ncbi:glycosyltransferase [Thermodesulfobacteriota bacterium]
MKIALLTASCRGGGAERVQITLAKEFQRLGNSVFFVSFEDDGPLRKDVPEEVFFSCFGVSRVVFGVYPLVQFLRKSKPDVIIATMTHVGIVALIAQVIALWDGKVLVRVDGSQRYIEKKVSVFKRFVLKLLQNRLFPRAFAVVGVSKSITEELQQDYHLNNCYTVHNPVEIFLGNDTQLPVAKHPFFESGEPVVIGIGRLVSGKGFSFLLRAFSVLRKTRKAKLILLGEGEERFNLEVEAKRLGLSEHVSFQGFVDNPFAYLKRSVVYALSSVSESFSLTLVEALSTGMPVVCTDTGGPRDILNDKRLGAIVPFGDVDSFAQALDNSLDSHKYNREMRISRASDFAPECIAAQYLRLIEG